MKYAFSVDTVLLGATFYAVGYAASAAESCMILERKGVVGCDFAECLHASRVSTASQSPITAAFARDLRTQKILSENGDVHIVATAFALAQFIQRAHIRILLETETISIERTENGFELYIFNRDGFQCLFAKQVIDTTPCATDDSFRTLGAMLANGNRLPDVSMQNGFVQNGIFEDEQIFHLRLEDGDDLIAANEKMRIQIEQSNLLADRQVASVAFSFAWHYPNGPVRMRTKNGVMHAVSASFGNLLNAMEGGVQDAVANDRKRKTEDR